MLSMNSKQSYPKPGFRLALENMRQAINSSGLIPLAGRVFGRLLNGLKSDLTVTIQAAKFVWRGPELDPKRFATEPPKWWFNEVEAVEVPEQGKHFEPKEGGFAVGFDGALIYSKGETAQEQKGWSDVSKQSVITPAEYGQMLAYKVSKKQTGLYNVVLAGKIKPYWLQGKKPGEIAVLIGEKTESLVRQYCICLERAKAQSHSPT